MNRGEVRRSRQIQVHCDVGQQATLISTGSLMAGAHGSRMIDFDPPNVTARKLAELMSAAHQPDAGGADQNRFGGELVRQAKPDLVAADADPDHLSNSHVRKLAGITSTR